MEPSFRLGLFDSLMDSPLCTADYKWTDDEIDRVIPPYNKDSNSNVFCPIYSFEVGLFRGKSSDESSKRLREDDIDEESSHTRSIKVTQAVDKLTSEGLLVADGSRDYTLPTIHGKHSDIRSISVDIMADVLCGKYDDKFGEVTIVDCRYPYEFDGGHIRDAVNLYTKDAVQSLLEKPVTSDKPHVLIFHCEFSSERGPNMCRFIRSQDRELNKDCYPKLNFPEIYLLDGGYNTFFATQQAHCEPMTYKPMLHKDHAADLRHFRVKSKSWTAGETQYTCRRKKNRRSRLSLEF